MQSNNPGKGAALHVHIKGAGIVAWCCASLLQRSGFAVSVEQTRGSHLPAILLDPVTEALLCYIAGDNTLFRGLQRVRSRTRAWGAHSGTVRLDHSAAILSPDAFMDGARISLDRCCGLPPRGADWTVYTSPDPRRGQDSFGSRRAQFADVRLKSKAERGACLLESVDCGWMFLIGGDCDRGFLLFVGGDPDSLLESSRHIAAQISGVHLRGFEVDAYPRIARRLYGNGWIACGTAAMSLDPICGDGLGHAVREAILATAVLRGIAAGGDRRGLLAHYSHRLREAFGRHLGLCRDFYSNGHDGEWWENELNSLCQGLHRDKRRAARKKWRYRLCELDLILGAPGREEKADEALAAEDIQGIGAEPIGREPARQIAVRQRLSQI